jgi:hypothetical protein
MVARKTNGFLVGVISPWPSHPKKMAPDRLGYPVEALTGGSYKSCGPRRTKGVAYGHPAEFMRRYFPQWRGMVYYTFSYYAICSGAYLNSVGAR